MTDLLAGTVALISGVGPGLGRDLALAFADHGADVAVMARTPSHLDPVVAEIEDRGRRAVAVPGDVTDEASCAEAVAGVLDGLGRLDCLVNNAFHGGDASALANADLDDWRHTMEVNLFGPLAMTRAATEALAAGGDGRVVMVNTMSIQRIARRWGAYAASKGALATVTKTLATELGPRGIRVNGMHPGYIWGDSVEWYFDHLAGKRGITAPEVYDEVAAETCLEYLPTSAEIAGTAIYLASPLARPVTGQMIGVNAGHWFNG